MLNISKMYIELLLLILILKKIINLNEIKKLNDEIVNIKKLVILLKLEFILNIQNLDSK